MQNHTAPRQPFLYTSNLPLSFNRPPAYIRCSCPHHNLSERGNKTRHVEAGCIQGFCCCICLLSYAKGGKKSYSKWKASLDTSWDIAKDSGVHAYFEQGAEFQGFVVPFIQAAVHGLHSWPQLSNHILLWHVVLCLWFRLFCPVKTEMTYCWKGCSRIWQ